MISRPCFLMCSWNQTTFEHAACNISHSNDQSQCSIVSPSPTVAKKGAPHSASLHVVWNSCETDQSPLSSHCCFFSCLLISSDHAFQLFRRRKSICVLFPLYCISPLTPSLLHGFSVSCTATSSVVLLCSLLLLCSSQAHLSFTTPPCSLSFLCLTLPSYPKLADIPFPGFLILLSPQYQNSRKAAEPCLALPLLPSLEEAVADFPTLTPLAFTVPLFCCSYHSCQAKTQAGTCHCPLAGIEDQRKKR